MPFSRLICLYFLKLLFAVPQLNLALLLADVKFLTLPLLLTSPESVSEDTEALNAGLRNTC